MLKSNSKKARENVKSYIIAQVTFEGYGKEPKGWSEIARTIWDIYNYEKGEREASEQRLFAWWLQGLPSIGLGEHYIKPAVDILGDILEETQEERAIYGEWEAEDYLSYLIFREVRKEATK